MTDRSAILIFTESSMKVAGKIKFHINGEIHGFAPRVNHADVTFNDTTAHIQELFSSGRTIIGVCSSGILIRTLGRLVSDKYNEPPVLAISEDGKNIVPLLGGHHGANRIATSLAGKLQGHAFVTTASDIILGSSLDEPPKSFVLANPRDFKSIIVRLLANEPVQISDDLKWVPKDHFNLSEDAKLSIVSTERNFKGGPDELVYHPKTLALGIGCVRGCGYDELNKLVVKSLKRFNLSSSSVSCIVSIDLKADETAIVKLANELNLPIRLFDAERLELETHRLKNPSEIVFKEVGCHGVAESSALAAAGDRGELIVEKQKSNNATLAIARSENPIDPMEIGRSRGRLAVIGIGPGHEDWRTPEATRLLIESDEIVGYSLYLNLASKLIEGKKCHDFPLGQEEKRARFALEQAATGKNVALISSGDAGIYAMGAIVFELLDRPEDAGGVSDQAHRVEIVGVPGISAFQAASARVGAPFGHDFCVISLSDLLTPWNVIERRLQAAADGDFVIAIYNPVSKRRRTQLTQAKTILLQKFPAETPVVIASNLGRKGENIRIVTLKDLSVDDVDMLTVLLIGSKSTRITNSRGSVKWMYTPRGYHNKREQVNR